MIRRVVRSSNVKSVGWEPSEEDPATGTLEVEFLSGGIYQYAEVPQSTFQALLGAASVGRYLNQNVIGTYTDSRV